MRSGTMSKSFNYNDLRSKACVSRLNCGDTLLQRRNALSAQASCSITCAAILRPMASDAVAAGDGAFSTCSALGERSR
jgi:hypothetical protein